MALAFTDVPTTDLRPRAGGTGGPAGPTPPATFTLTEQGAQRGSEQP